MKLSEIFCNIWVLGMALDCALFGVVAIKAIFVI
jgi:hypothetical protein